MADIFPPSATGTPPAPTDIEPIVTPQAPTVELPIAAIPDKKPGQSWTLRFNGVLAVLGIVMPVVVALQPQLAESLQRAIPNPEIGIASVGVLTAVIGLVNVVIRIYRTSMPVAH